MQQLHGYLSPRSRNGFTLLEVLVSLSILGLSLVAALQIFSRTTKDYIVSRDTAAGDQIEQMIRSTIFRRVQGYFYNVSNPNPPYSAACDDNKMPASQNFASLWASITPEGVQLTQVTSALASSLTGLLAANDASRAFAKDALVRCPSDTIGATGGNLTAQNGLYFCLQLTSPGGAVLMNDVRAMQPLFAELRFTTSKPSDTATPLKACNLLPNYMSYGFPRGGLLPLPSDSQQRQLIGTLDYSLYWTIQDQGKVVGRNRIGSVAQSWAW